MRAQALVAEGARAVTNTRASSRASSRSRNGPAGVALVGGRLVGRRRAAHRRGDPRAGEAQPVVAGGARRLVGEAGAVEGGVEEVARAVAGEHPAGAVGAVGGRGQADDHDPGVGIAEARARAGPSTPRRGTAARFSAATCSRHATRRGQARHVDHLALDLAAGRRRRSDPRGPTIGWLPTMARTDPRSAAAHARAARPPRADAHHRQGAARAGPPGLHLADKGRAAGRGRGRAHRRAADRRAQGRGGLRLAARAHPGDGRPHRQGPRPAGAARPRACSRATSATGPAPS